MFNKIGFIGLGTMGMPISLNLQKKYGNLLISNFNPESAEILRKAGADVADHNAQMATQCNLIFLSLPTPKIVETVVAGENGLLTHGRPGLCIIDTSTINYGLSLQLSGLAKEKGITFIDAPVSGGAEKAAAGTLSIIVGATKEEIAEVKLTEYFETIGGNIHYAGTRGSGVALKIINNMLSKSILFADAEAIVLAEHLGISYETLYNVIMTSTSQNDILRIKNEHIATHDYSPSTKSFFPVVGALKDLTLARQLIDETDIASFGCNNMIQWWRMAEQRGYGDFDVSSIVEMLRELQPIKDNK